jgi:RNA polymerase sigma factor (TIGR02999 family)
MAKENAGHTFQSADLVNEAFVRLVTGASVNWRDRVHFFAVSARVLRRILVDAARGKAAVKRGGAAWVNADLPVDPEKVPDVASMRAAELCALDDALAALARFDERRARVVELRFFGGLAVDEAAAVLGVSAQTVLRDWRLARAWLAREMTR